MSSLTDMTLVHGVRNHQYADDTQIYIFIKKYDVSADIATLECNTNAVYTYPSNNGLALDPSTSEFVKFDFRRQITGQITATNVAEASIQRRKQLRAWA